MDPELQKRLAAILDYLLETTKKGVELAGEQLPLIAWEQVAYARAWHTTIVCISLLIIFIALRKWKSVRAWDKEHTYAADEGVPTAFYVVAAIVIPSIVFAFQLNSMLKVWFAPRVYLLEWAVSLASSATSGTR